MTLLERLNQDIKAAMLARDAGRLGTLRLLKSAIGYAQIERKNENLSDAEVITILQKELKKRRDSITQYEQGHRADLAAQEKLEAGIIEAYLPRPLTPAELEQLVKAAIQETGATGKPQMGLVMKAAQAKAAGRADGKAISECVGRLLA
ncbi:MAG TPA: GatB/YqeY domain-containing protein [Verrucomicrobiae bacterium]|nr:GatB/YqeY domain-containing protein [Verrucomicrobiae bacterium]